VTSGDIQLFVAGDYVGAKFKCRVSGILSVLEADMKHARNLTMSAKELDRLEIIGRVVERANLTLQDRLVKELRLRHISTPAAGNDYLSEFCVNYNQRFGREPQSAHDAHLPLCDQEYKRVMYLVKPGSGTLALAGERCCVHEYYVGQDPK
jgi:hypothetical protein